MAAQDAGFSFRSHENDELATAPAVFTAISVTGNIKENKYAKEPWLAKRNDHKTGGYTRELLHLPTAHI